MNKSLLGVRIPGTNVTPSPQANGGLPVPLLWLVFLRRGFQKAEPFYVYPIAHSLTGPLVAIDSYSMLSHSDLKSGDF